MTFHALLIASAAEQSGPLSRGFQDSVLRAAVGRLREQNREARVRELTECVSREPINRRSGHSPVEELQAPIRFAV